MPGAQDVPRLMLSLVPLAVLQPLLDHIARHVGRAQPRVFARLGPHTRTRFLIDPTDLPFVLLLKPEAAAPRLTAYRRSETPANDACIRGSFVSLLSLLDASGDGDALFFSRDLRVTGDIEAVVRLRNALDDLEGDALTTVVGAFGPFSTPVAFGLNVLRNAAARQRHA